MKIIKSKLSDQILEYHAIGLGQFYFLKDIVVAEINEGVHVDFKASQESISVISDFYGTEKPIGYICNRINNFSISPLDYPKFINSLPNLTIFGIVHNNHFDRMNYEIEKRFCNRPYKAFTDLYSAFNQVSNFVKNVSKRVDIIKGNSIVKNDSIN
jgi:hypothetical protein